MNNFELPPNELFVGPMSWFGIRDSRFGRLELETKGIRDELNTKWPPTIKDRRPKGQHFLSHLIGLLVKNSDVLSETNMPVAELEFLGFALSSDGLEGIVEDSAINTGWLGVNYMRANRWAFVGVAPNCAVSAFARQDYRDSLDYGPSEPGPLTMHIRPLRPDVAVQVAEVTS